MYTKETPQVLVEQAAMRPPSSEELSSEKPFPGHIHLPAKVYQSLHQTFSSRPSPLTAWSFWSTYRTREPRVESVFLGVALWLT